MFWRIGFASVSAIDGLLDKPDITLEALMNEDELIQECKSMNKKLLTYLAQPNIISELIALITKEPDASAGVERKFKYPYLACEILCCEISAIYDVMFQEEDLSNSLFAFLDDLPPLNPLLAGYFCRVVGILLQKKPLETLAFAKKRKDLLHRFVEHLGTYSVMTLLLKVVSGDDLATSSITQATRDSIEQWFVTSGLIASLLQKFDPQLDSEIHANAAEALAGIISKQCSPASTSTSLVAQIQNTKLLEDLMQIILGGSHSVLMNGLSVVIELLQRSKFGFDLQGQRVEDQPAPAIVAVLVKNIDKLCTLLRQAPPTTMLTTVGTFVPLGPGRLKVVEFFVAFISSKHPQVYDVFMKADVVTICMDLFYEYKWNNLLHAQVERLIAAIVDSDSDTLKSWLFTSCNIVQRVLEGYEEDLKRSELPKSTRLGYMGHLTKIANSLVKCGQADSKVQALLDENERWKEYVAGPLAVTNLADSTQLGGNVPPTISERESEEDELFGPNLDMEVLQNMTDFKANGSDQRFERYFFDQADGNDDFDHLNDDADNNEFSFEGDPEFDASAAFTDENSIEDFGGGRKYGPTSEIDLFASQAPLWPEREIVDKSKLGGSGLTPAASASAGTAPKSGRPAAKAGPSKPLNMLDSSHAQTVDEDDTDDVVVQYAGDDDEAAECPEEIEGEKASGAVAAPGRSNLTSPRDWLVFSSLPTPVEFSTPVTAHSQADSGWVAAFDGAPSASVAPKVVPFDPMDPFAGFGSVSISTPAPRNPPQPEQSIASPTADDEDFGDFQAASAESGVVMAVEDPIGKLDQTSVGKPLDVTMTEAEIVIAQGSPESMDSELTGAPTP
mmetsp:Transcript_21511/g.36882  ORF Transcript_21511/g.36882 Transcript_21511/m.36882 type:complete len:844 (-) Transcript_21511:515-3046(-)